LDDQAVIVPLEEASREPFSLVLSYPQPNPFEIEHKIQQLKNLKVGHLVFGGNLAIDKIHLLGKGVSGLVVAGIVKGERVALKIRRVDSRRGSMEHEASMLKLANSVEVGPKYLGNTPDILAMELVEGDRLPAWLSALKGRGRRSTVRLVVKELLDQCLRLDRCGLDHGELSRAHKNILVPGDCGPYILDFESASTNRRSSNLTSLVQYFFLGGVFSRKIQRVVGPTDRKDLLEEMRSYKSGEFQQAYDRTKRLLNLDIACRSKQSRSC
jgi:putative serine/threonine protein kinase